MSSVTTIPFSDVPVDHDSRAVCPDCNGDPHSAADKGCPGCEAFHSFDSHPRPITDLRWNDWDSIENPLDSAAV